MSIRFKVVHGKMFPKDLKEIIFGGGKDPWAIKSLKHFSEGKATISLCNSHP